MDNLSQIRYITIEKVDNKRKQQQYVLEEILDPSPPGRPNILVVCFHRGKISFEGGVHHLLRRDCVHDLVEKVRIRRHRKRVATGDALVGSQGVLNEFQLGKSFSLISSVSVWLVQFQFD